MLKLALQLLVDEKSLVWKDKLIDNNIIIIDYVIEVPSVSGNLCVADIINKNRNIEICLKSHLYVLNLSSKNLVLHLFLVFTEKTNPNGRLRNQVNLISKLVNLMIYPLSIGTAYFIFILFF